MCFVSKGDKWHHRFTSDFCSKLKKNVHTVAELIAND